MALPLIYSQDWFSNRNSLGKFSFDKSGAIYNFNNNSVSKILYGSKLNDLFNDPRCLERECEALNILINKNKPASVTIHKNGDSSYTDGQKIVLSGQSLINYKESGLDIVLGLLCHESSHIRFTDFHLFKNDVSEKPMLKWIWNLIEDEVIEEMLQLEKPGLGNLLGPVKDYMFSNNFLNSNFKDDIDIISYILFALIRYPINLQKLPVKYLTYFEDLFNDIYAILKSNNVLNVKIKDNCSSENIKAAKEIYELLKEYIKENKVSGTGKSVPGEDCEGDGGENKAGENNENGDSVENSEESKNGGISDKEAEDMLNGKFDENGKNISESFSDMNGTLIGECIPEGKEKDIIEQIENLSKFPIEVEDYHPEYIEKENDYNRGNAPTKFLKRIFKVANALNTEKYKRLAKEVKPYIDLIKKIEIKETKRKMTLKKEEFVRNGSLDPRLLVSAIQNIKNVYQRHGVKTHREKNQKFTVVLAIDESGSMTGKLTRETATKIAISFVEAFKDNENIDIYVYGHSDYITKYVEPKMKYFDVLLNRYQGIGQNEVKAYNTIVKDINKDTKSNLLFINITDAQYLSNYSEIENEMKKWDRNIFQSLIVVNNKVTPGDINFNDRVYGKDNWGIITDINNIENTSKELKKVIKYINKLANKFKK